MRRILNIPPDTHNYLIPLLFNNALPFLDDVCKRSARLVFSCIQSDSSLVRSIAKHGIFEGAAVILLLEKMRRFYAHILVGNSLTLYIAKLILVNPAFCLTFITRLVKLNGVRLSCLKMFLLLVMMNLR